MVRFVVLLAFALLGLVSCDEFTTPFGASVAFGGAVAGTGASVTWSTFNATGTPFCYIYQEGQSSSGRMINGYTDSYYTSSFQHHVVVDELEAFTRYSYHVGMMGAVEVSDTFSFVTARAAGDSSAFSFSVFGDMGIQKSKNTFQRLLNLDTVDFFLHVGDISYADDENAEHLGTYEQTWDKFQTAMENVSANYPYMVCPGNHEATCVPSGEVGCPDQLNNFSAYRHRFLMPSQESGGVENMWYSFDYGMAHFVVLSSETDFQGAPEGTKSLWGAGPFGDQMSWLQNDLNQAVQNRDNIPWLIVVAHRPLYSTGAGDFPPNAKKTWRGQVEDMFYEANVDLYLSGHVHAYERMYPIYQGDVEMNGYNNPRDLTPLVIGNAGCEEGLNRFSATQDFIAFRNNTVYGYGIVNIQDESTLSFQMLNSEDNSELDGFTLIRNR